MHSMNRKKRVLLGVSGSVAAIKGPELCLRLMEQGFEVKVVLTSGGSNFWHKANEYNGEAWLKLQEAKEKNLLIIHCALIKKSVCPSLRNLIPEPPISFMQLQSMSGSVGIAWATLCFTLNCVTGPI